MTGRISSSPTFTNTRSEVIRTSLPETPLPKWANSRITSSAMGVASVALEAGPGPTEFTARTWKT